MTTNLTSTCVVLAVLVTAPVRGASPNHILASVRLGATGGCSGTIIASGEEYAYGLSAAHCASGVGKQFTFGTVDGQAHSARWIAVDRSVDLALFKCWSRDILAHTPVMVGLPEGKEDFIAVGYPSGVGPNVKEVSIRGTGEVMTRNWYRVNSGRHAPGDSGGGVFYGDYLIGVITHTGGPTVMYAAQNTQIVKFCEANESKITGCPDGWCWRPKPNVPIDLNDLDSDKDRTKAIEEILKRLDGLTKHDTEINIQVAEILIQMRDYSTEIATLQAELKALRDADSDAVRGSELKKIEEAWRLELGLVADQLGRVEDYLKALADRPIVLQVMTRDGRVIREMTFPGGKPVKILPAHVQFVDKRNRVIVDQDGEPVEEWFPYGTPIRIRRDLID